MQLARLLMYWNIRRWSGVALCMVTGLGVAPVTAQEAAAPIAAAAASPLSVAEAETSAAAPLPSAPSSDTMPQPMSAAALQPGLGSPYFAVSAGPVLASFFTRLLMGGSIAIAGGAMLSSSLGLVGQARVDIGGLDLRYLTVSSGRISVGLIARLNERATLIGSLGGGLIGFTRNTTRTDTVTAFAALELGSDIDLVSWVRASPSAPTTYQASHRLFLPISLGLLVMPFARNSFLDASARIGLGYRYR